MPAYDFRCTSCRHLFEVVRPPSDTSPLACPECGATTKRVFTAVGIHFKGTGFHNTDYKDQKAIPAAPAKPELPAKADGGCAAASGGGCAGCPAAGGD
jgi:putative FmdB family regulatory protein